MELPEPLAVTLRVANAFDRLGLKYLVGGSLASSLHGIPRSTNDADVLAELPGHRVDELVKDLSSDFYVDADMIRDAVRRGASFNVIHLPTMFKVDVFVLTRDPLLTEEMSRRQSHALDEQGRVQMQFASAEDTVLQKLDWFKKGAGVSDRQWADIRGILEVQGDRLDLAYMRRWAPHLSVSDLLERALTESRR